MNSYNLWDAIGKIEDRFIYDAIEVKKKTVHSVSRWLVGAAAVLILAAVSFSAAYTVSAQFREWVISLFQMKETELVPDSEHYNNKQPIPQNSRNNTTEKGHISLYATDTLEDVFAVQYLKSDNYLDAIGPLFYYYEPSSGTRKYYAAENSKFVPIESHSIKRKVTMLGITGDIDYTRIDYRGKLFLEENNCNRFALDDKNDAEFILGVSGNNEVGLTLYKNPQSDKWCYPAGYNLETGEVNDIMKGIRVDGMELKEYPVLRNWDTIGDELFIVTLGQSMKDAKAFLIDTKKKTAVSLSELTGISNILSAKVVEDKIMMLEPIQDEKFNYYSYDYSMHKTVEIYKGAEYWSLEKQEDGSPQVRFSGGRYDFLEKAGTIYLVDEISGERLTVEGITKELGDTPVTNYNNDKILVETFGDDFIKQMGIIDIKAGKFYLLNRKNQYGIHEYSISWNDADQVVINAEADNYKKSYVYLYSLIK